MLVTIGPPMVDPRTQMCADPDLLPVELSRHSACKGHSKIVVGFCRPSDGSVLVLNNRGLSKREADDVRGWARRLLQNEEFPKDEWQRLTDERSNSPSV